MRKLFILVLVLVGVAVYLLWNKNTTEITSKSTNTPTVAGIAHEWVLQEGETGSSGIPNTTISLKVNGKSYPLGDYDGSCKEVESGENGVLGEKPDTGEISRVQCWFAGSGNEIGVFKVGAKTVVKVGELSEGEDGGKPFRGNWKILLEL